MKEFKRSEVQKVSILSNAELLKVHGGSTTYSREGYGYSDTFPTNPSKSGRKLSPPQRGPITGS